LYAGVEIPFDEAEETNKPVD